MLRRLVLIIAPFAIFCAIIATAGVCEWRRSVWKAKYQPVDLTRLGYFNFDAANCSVADIPLEFRKLDGRRIRLEGMVGGQCTIDGHHQLQLFGRPRNNAPLPHDHVLVTTRNWKCLSCGSGTARAYGTLHVRVPDAGSPHVYTLDADLVEIVGLAPQSTGSIPALSTFGSIGLLIVFALWWVIRQRSSESLLRRRAAGQCIYCGYDLRGSAARCPECGTSGVTSANLLW